MLTTRDKKAKDNLHGIGKRGEKMELDKRKSAILKALIEDYIETAEPVGSRTIAKKCDIGLSSATIRNEMSDLEEMGYLAQPHASAGRIPSNMGYRLYVDNLIKKIKTTNAQMEYLKTQMEANLFELNKLLDFAAKTVSEKTGLTAITNITDNTAGAISHFDMVKITEHYLTLILVTDRGIVRNRQVKILTPITNDSVSYIKGIINEELGGLSFNEFTPTKIEHIKAKFNQNFELLGVILDFLTESMAETTAPQIYMQGKSHTLKAPEFSDTEKIMDFLELVDNKDKVNELILSISKNQGTTVIIGDESPVLKNKDLSIVVSSYKAYDGRTGLIGVIGPKRMDYAKVISTLESMSRTMENLLESGE